MISTESKSTQIEGRNQAGGSVENNNNNYKSNKSIFIFPLLSILIPSSFLLLASIPVLILTCIVPLIGFFSFFSLIIITLLLIYTISWSLYLLLAQDDLPLNVSKPFLPYAPLKCFKVTSHFFKLIKQALTAKVIHLVLDSQLKRVVILGGKDRKEIIKENILYKETNEFGKRGKRLDVYLPLRRKWHGETGSNDDEIDFSREGGSRPVVILVGGGGFGFWRKSMGSLVALRLKRMGYMVVVPDISKYPNGKCSDAVSDFRYVAEWTAARCASYGGDPTQIYVIGYGSGAHLTLLTVVQDAVVTCRDEYLQKLSTPTKDQDPDQPLDSSTGSSSNERLIEISAGIKRVEIISEEAQLPNFAGMIFISGIFDLIKQLRWETAAGIDDISGLRRASGPAYAQTLINCPSHLLYGSKQLLDPILLPPKFLIIAGGKDTLVPYSQSVLLRNLLLGVGVENVKLRLYKEETHFGSLGSLMHQTRYTPMILHEIDLMLSSGLR